MTAKQKKTRKSIVLREMGVGPKQHPMMAALYRKAEARVKELSRQLPPPTEDQKSEIDSRRVLHELQVHQVELEMQNAELQESREKIEAMLGQFTDLYDFAPVGYFSFTANGTIQQVNLTGAALLGKERTHLIGRSFGVLLSLENRAHFHDFLSRVFASDVKQSVDLELAIPHQPFRTVNLTAQHLPTSLSCRAALVDITERKRAEAATAQMAAIVQSSSDAIIGKDLHSVITSWNAGAEKIFGYSAQEMVGTSICRLIPADRQREEAHMMDRVHRGESVEHFETVRVAKDGRLLDISVTVSPIRIAGGKITGASKVARDITSQKRVENELRSSEMRYRRLFEASVEGVLILDPVTCTITDANPFMSKLLGYSHAQLLGRQLFEIGLLKDQAASRTMFENLKKSHEIRYENLPLKSKSGRHQEVEVVASLYMEGGQSVIQCKLRDITERKRMELLLRHNESLFTTLVDQVPVGMYLVDAHMRLQQFNPRAIPVFKNVRPLVGRSFPEIMRIIWPKPISESIIARFRHTLRTGEPYRAPEFSGKRRDTGTVEHFEWQIQRITLPAGERAVVCYFNNITERKEAEAAQRRLESLAASHRLLEQEVIRRRTVEQTLKQKEQHQKDLLDHSNKMQEHLRNFSRQVLQAQEDERREISRELHDVIGQTLTGINIRLAALKKEAGRNIKGFDRNITRTQKLVEKSVEIVHQFARELRPAVLDDLGLIPALHSFMNNFKARTGIHIEFKAFAGVEDLEMPKRTALFRVAQEALTNVSRHAKASRVEVTLQKTPAGVCMEIKDDGQSFNVESKLPAHGGKRLGLLGMQERLEMVGGTFNIASAPGRGTTISAQIPFGKPLKTKL